MAELPEDWGNGRVAIDVECRDEKLSELGPGVRRGAYISGISFAIEDGPAYYLPIRQGGGGNMDANQVLSYLRYQAKRFNGVIAGANLGYDLDFLMEEDIHFNPKFFRDVQIADPLINELHYQYGLDAIAERWGVPGKDERLLKEALAAYGYKGTRAKAGIWALPARHVGPYAEQDARLPLTILRKQEREIDAQDLWKIYDMESRLLPVLIRMRRRGVAVSLEKLEKVEIWARAQQQEAIDAANRHLVGRRLDFHDITKTAAVAVCLRDLGIQLPKTAKGTDSVTAAVMERLDHPIGEHLRRAKKMSTLRTTFCDGVRDHLINGRIHCTFNQLRRQKDDGSDETEGAAYGRLSSTNPNLQNQPARDPEIGPMWRTIYEPDEGKLWACLDYSQQEPRHSVHFAVEAGPKLLGREAYEAAVEAARRYREDPKTDFHDMMTRMVHGDDFLERAGKKAFSQARKHCKNIYLGLSYGMGGPKLCRDLGLPTAFRIGWKLPNARRRQFKDFETREEALAKVDAGRNAGYEVRMWECAGREGQALMDTFDQRVPFIRKMASLCQDEAAKLGYILTYGGRRCRFPKLDDGTYDWLHKAFNRRIQGSSADQTKEAVIQLDAAGYPLQLQVHDEVDFSATDRREAEEAGEIMANVYQLHVPMRVDVEIGPSWGEVA